MKELSYDEHFEIIKNLLKVNPPIVKGKAAEELIYQYGGSTHTNGGYIHIDNLNTVAVKKSSAIGTLAHELRHAWQHKNKESEGFYFNLRPVGLIETIKYGIVYLIGKTELDANIFALRYCMLIGLWCQAAKYTLIIGFTWFCRLVALGVILGSSLVGIQHTLMATVQPRR